MGCRQGPLKGGEEVEEQDESEHEGGALEDNIPREADTDILDWAPVASPSEAGQMKHGDSRRVAEACRQFAKARRLDCFRVAVVFVFVAAACLIATVIARPGDVSHIPYPPQLYLSQSPHTHLIHIYPNHPIPTSSISIPSLSQSSHTPSSISTPTIPYPPHP